MAGPEIHRQNSFWYIYEEGEFGRVRPAQIKIPRRGWGKPTAHWNGMQLSSEDAAREVLRQYGDPDTVYLVSQESY